jgi:hypothetical protein
VTYYTCLHDGELSQVGTTAPICKSNATQISWNSRGPQGPPGTNGTNGLSNALSASNVNGTAVSWSDADTFHPVESISPPSGDYVVTVHVELLSNGNPQWFQCELVDSEGAVHDTSLLPGNQFPGAAQYRADGSLEATMSLTGSVTIQCENFTYAQTTDAFASLVAVQVNHLNE